MPRTASYAVKRGRIIEAIGRGGTDSQIARETYCSREYVRMVRASLGLPSSSGSAPGRMRVPAAPVGPNVLEADGGSVVIEPASEGRALLTVHEKHHATAIVRLTKPQLVALLEGAIAVLDSLPDVAPEVVGSLDDPEAP